MEPVTTAELPLPRYLELACPPQASSGELLDLYAWATGLDTVDGAQGPEYATLPLSKRPLARELVPRRMLTMIQPPNLKVESSDILASLMVIVQDIPGLSSEDGVEYPFPLPSKVEVSNISGKVVPHGTEIGDFLFSILKMKRDDGTLFGYRQSLITYMKKFKGIDYEPNGRLISVASVPLATTAISIVNILSPRHTLVFGTQEFCKEYRKTFAAPQHLCIDIKNYSDATDSIIKFVREVNEVD